MFKARFLSWKQRFWVVLILLVGNVGLFWILGILKSNFLFAESFISVGCFVAFCLQTKKFIESYVLYTLCNAISVGIWFCIFTTTPESIAQLVSSVVFLCVGAYYGYSWVKQKS